jgi:hypothetical protein
MRRSFGILPFATLGTREEALPAAGQLARSAPQQVIYDSKTLARI